MEMNGGNRSPGGEGCEEGGQGGLRKGKGEMGTAAWSDTCRRESQGQSDEGSLPDLCQITPFATFLGDLSQEFIVFFKTQGKLNLCFFWLYPSTGTGINTQFCLAYRILIKIIKLPARKRNCKKTFTLTRTLFCGSLNKTANGFKRVFSL